MRESTGNTFLYYIVLVFLILALLVLVGSFGFSKAFKAKNKIIRVIEDRLGYNSTVMDEIDRMLGTNGYRVKSAYRNPECPVSVNGGQLLAESEKYYYCVYSHETIRGVYYSVVVYTRFEIPLINGLLQFPVHGDTRTIYDLNY